MPIVFCDIFNPLFTVNYGVLQRSKGQYQKNVSNFHSSGHPSASNPSRHASYVSKSHFNPHDPHDPEYTLIFQQS
jgi:hypothetical protein